MRTKWIPGLLALCLGCGRTTAEQPTQTAADHTDMSVQTTAETVNAEDGISDAASQAETGIASPETGDTAPQPQQPQGDMPAPADTAQGASTPSDAQEAPTGDAAETASSPQDTSAPQAEASGEAKPESLQEEPLTPAVVSPEAVHALHTAADWFVPEASKKWYKQTTRHANRKFLAEYFDLIGYQAPKNTYALIAPLSVRGGKLSMQYYSYRGTAFEFSMTKDGEEKYWPASTVKLAAAVMALLKLSEYGTGSQATVSFTDLEGHYENTVEKLCREAIIPSNNTAYNRLMEIAGFDEINDHYLRDVFHFPKMVLQRRYVRHHPEDSLRDSPEIQFTDGTKSGTIPERHSSGKMRPECPRESNCTTLAELAEVIFRVVLHEELPKSRQLALAQPEIDMLRDALHKAPSCIGDGVTAAMGPNMIVYNKGGKVIGDDRLEVAVVSTPNKKERYLVALSMPYYEGVEKETNRLAMHLIDAMRHR